MREQELRLAVVMTGGVSLAVHMFGIARELQKLVRASRIYHGLPASARAASSYRGANDDPDRETDTEEIYFELLQALAPDHELRIVIDVISGASAGGVNGAMLARSLAHDLPLDSHRDIWLERADVLRLMDGDAASRPWSKVWLVPVMRAAYRSRLSWLAADAEAQVKLSRFLRSRWFRPPFSGRLFVNWLLDACDSMASGREETRSLLPDGHTLDLFISLTHFHGHAEPVPLNDPPDAEELEHKVLLHLSYERQRGGEARSDFDRESAPGLAFAARATSCFPGAFEAASVAEVDGVLAMRGRVWERREDFLDRHFARVKRCGRDPCEARFIDGSVVDNKPFAAALAALVNRPAHREVLRRVVYIEPDPAKAASADPDLRTPGMMRSILSALAEIPRNEPVHDELERVAALNRRIALVRQVVAHAHPRVGALVANILGAGPSCAPTSGEIAEWRARANAEAAAGAGFAFESYFQLKLLVVRERMEALLREGWTALGAAPDLVRLRIALQALTVSDDRIQADGDREAARARPIAFLRAFDAEFRIRRLRHLIRRLNELYLDEGPGEAAPDRAELDELKTTLYQFLDRVRARIAGPSLLTPPMRGALAAFAAEPDARPDDLFAALETHLGLVALDDELDEIFSVMVLNYLPPRHRAELMTSYIGFSFFDVLCFPMMQGEDLGELKEVLIDRISPVDARGLRAAGCADALKGTRFRNFGSFFSRAWRENDYLWGRLTAADRLVGIVAKAVGAEGKIDAGALRMRLFRAIVEAERPHLTADPDLLAGLDAELERAASGQPHGRHGQRGAERERPQHAEAQ
jgi:patatin-related protein